MSFMRCALRRDGYVVLRNVLSQRTVRRVRRMAARDSSSHSRAMWELRSLAVVRHVFADVWDDPDLIVSFDGMTVKRPWEPGLVLPAHVDQCVRGMECVQGLFALSASNEATGGTVLYRGSHAHHDALMTHAGVRDNARAWQYVEVDPIKLKAFAADQPSLRAGDALLWDSRTVHAAAASTNQRTARLVAYITMTPRCMATKRTLLRRRDAVAQGRGSTHWPHRVVLHEPTHRAPRLTSVQRALV